MSLIEKEYALEKAENQYYLNIIDERTKNEIIKFIKNLPPAQPEIIRCRDCRFYEWMSNRVPEEQTWYCHNWNAETGKDDYCSYAERRQK